MFLLVKSEHHATSSLSESGLFLPQISLSLPPFEHFSTLQAKKSCSHTRLLDIPCSFDPPFDFKTRNTPSCQKKRLRCTVYEAGAGPRLLLLRPLLLPLPSRRPGPRPLEAPLQGRVPAVGPVLLAEGVEGAPAAPAPFEHMLLLGGGRGIVLVGRAGEPVGGEGAPGGRGPLAEHEHGF